MLDSAAVARSALRLLARMEGRSGTAFPMGTPRLSDLTATLAEARVDGDGDPRIRDVTYRSGEARPGALFFAVPGSRTDGHDHVAEAAGRGAVAAIVERPVKAPLLQMVVPSVRRAMGPVSAAFFGRPADRMTLLGVTGTNGKTTTTYLLESILRAAGVSPGLVGTTGVRIAGRAVPQARTTPEAPDLHRLFRRMADEGVGGVAMEVSSHGLDQHRVDGVRFDCAVFTNLSQDHLDYHGTLRAYLEAKARLFTAAMADRAAVNHDSPEGRSLAGRLPTLTFGVASGADLRARDVEVTPTGVSFVADGLRLRSRLRGEFSVYNCLAAAAAARQVGLPDDAIEEGVASLPGVPGRIEPVEAGQPFLVLVDYAHTPDSVENVLSAARALVEQGGRLIVALGCGGDRDAGKRPLMGQAATRLADLTVITSDNPRSEDPLEIIRQIEPGAIRGGGPHVVEPDRRAAIRLAVREARAGDVVVLAGKGHETGQEFADRTIPFDDRVVAGEELRAMLQEAT